MYMQCIIIDILLPQSSPGINVALQTGFQLKTVLTPEEMAVMVSGYSDSMQVNSCLFFIAYF